MRENIDVFDFELSSADMQLMASLDKNESQFFDHRDPAAIDGENQAIIRVVRASVCGSDLWWYRGIAKREANTLVGHEAIGVVEQVSADVSQIKAGDFVIVPFTHGC